MNTASPSPEFIRAMGPVAIEVLGEPNQARSTKTELCWGNCGSLKVNTAKGGFFDHETGEKGGVLAFLKAKLNLERPAALQWLRDRKHLPPADANGHRRIAATYDYVSMDGNLLFQVVRYEPKNFLQRCPDGRGGWQWRMTGVQRVIYRLPQVVKAVAAGHVIHLAEGEKGVHAVESLGLTATCSPGGAGKWRPEYNQWLDGADVVLLPDNDEPGRKHVAQVAGFLRGIARRVRILPLPNLTEKTDVADWVQAGGTKVELEALIAKVKPEVDKASSPDQTAPTKPKLAADQPRVTPGADKPVILLKPGTLHLVTTAAEAAIIDAAVPVFQRGPTLVRPAVWEVAASQNRTAYAAGLSTMKAAGLVDVFSACADFRRYDARAKTAVPTNPPTQVADILLSRFGLWNLASITGVITTPTLRPDGSILSASGYDPATRLYHAADPNLTLDRAVYAPTRADAEQALTVLLDLLLDFPFVTIKAEGQPDRQPSLAVALSGLITPVVRGALQVAPMHAVRANAPGTGKSYLLDLISAIATGQPCPVMSVAPDDPKETEKRLIGLLLAGLPIISLDNVNGELGGDTLAQAIERPLLRLRPLGSSDMIMIASRATIFANGNQLRVRDDMLRRTLAADLDAEMERPETRTFRGDPVATVLDNRGRYVSAAIIIVRAYQAAGSPGCLPPLASFGQWSDLVRSALVWLGCDDPAGVMEQTRAEDPGLVDLRELMDLWDDTFRTAGMTLKAVISEANQMRIEADEYGDIPEYGGKRVPCHPELRDLLIRVSDGRNDIDPERLGKWMRDRVAGRVVGTRRFVKDGATASSTRWKLVAVKNHS